MVPRRVVAKKATSPGLVFKWNFMLNASRRLHRKKGVQHTRKHTKQIDRQIYIYIDR